jgi:hypothetical protein
MHYFDLDLSYTKKKELISHYLTAKHTAKIDRYYNPISHNHCHGFELLFNNNICVLCEKVFNKQYKIKITSYYLMPPTITLTKQHDIKNKFKICQECLKMIDDIYFKQPKYTYQFNHHICEFLLFKDKWIVIILCLQNSLYDDVILYIMLKYINSINMII